MKPITLGPKPEQRESQLAAVCRFIMSAHIGKPINIKITVARTERTDRQNAYLWGVAYKILGEHMGHSADELHEWLCGEYFGWQDRALPGGRVTSVPLRTTTKPDKLDDREFWKYVEFIQRKAAEAGVYMPDPEGK